MLPLTLLALRSGIDPDFGDFVPRPKSWEERLWTAWTLAPWDASAFVAATTASALWPMTRLSRRHTPWTTGDQWLHPRLHKTHTLTHVS